MNKFSLNNRTAIVTGGAQGFGLAMTKRFLSSGFSDFKRTIILSCGVSTLILYSFHYHNHSNLAVSVSSQISNSNQCLIPYNQNRYHGVIHMRGSLYVQFSY